jgi:hypothetical protein
MTTTGRSSFSDYLHILLKLGQNSEMSTASVDEERDSQNSGMVTKNDFY